MMKKKLRPNKKMDDSIKDEWGRWSDTVQVWFVPT